VKLFELGYSDWEDWGQWLFLHDNKTQDEFEQDCKDMFVKYGEEYINKDDCWVSASDWAGFAMEHMGELGYAVPERLHFGFREEMIIDGRGRDEQYNWQKIVGDKLYNMAIKKNKEIEEEMHPVKEPDKHASRNK